MAKRWGPGNPLWEWQHKRKGRRASRKATRKVKVMVRRRFYGRKRRGFRRPKSMGIVGGLALGLGATAGIGAYNGFQQAGLQGALINGLYTLTGYDAGKGTWDTTQTMRGVGTVALCVGGGYAFHKLAQMSGLNRYLPKKWAI